MRTGTIAMALLSALGVSCTFYTACPTPAPAANNGGSGNTGGSNTGGSNGGTSGKPLVKWTNVTGDLAGKESTCGNLSLVVAKGERVLVSVNPGRLFATSDAGESWTQIAQGEGSDVMDASLVSMAVDPEHAETFWVSGIYGMHGVWRTDDDGDTFKALGDVRHNDVVSIDFTDPERQFLMAGGHEQTGIVWRSLNGGEQWEDIGQSFPKNTPVSSYPYVISKDRVLFGSAGYAKGEPGIFLSTDMGDSWERLASAGGLGKPLVTTSGDMYWGSDRGGVVKSEDGGDTWAEALPPDSVWGTTPLIELPDHRLAVLTAHDGIKISDDGLKTLTPLVEPLPFLTNAITYSDTFRAFFVGHSDCGEVVLDDAVMRADWDYEDSGGASSQ